MTSALRVERYWVRNKYTELQCKIQRRLLREACIDLRDNYETYYFMPYDLRKNLPGKVAYKVNRILLHLGEL